jgi:hypothetical protein
MRKRRPKNAQRHDAATEPARRRRAAAAAAAAAAEAASRKRAWGCCSAAAAEDDGGVVVCVANHRRSELPFTNRRNNAGAYGTAARLYVSTPMPLCDRRHILGPAT